ncbi:hypothetical protein [Streptomyces acidicola]|uniref:Calcium-binding protein n=1 Tax=Streptomyces acidicola TaxID=2596892 RepID=A0A5N8X725_9ACTN|nr:hypothetical protein [Streptomyces acidicola]MPY54996.1 hypothetical protein [Streptomyces acidicola]
MHRRTLPIALSGLLALSAVGLSSPSAYAAESDISFSNIVVNGGKPIVVGTSKMVSVPVTYTIRHSVKLDWHYVFLYRGVLNGSEKTLGSGGQGPYCTANSSGTVENCEMTVDIVPKDDLVNADATTWKTGGTGIKPNGSYDTDKNSVTASVKRYAKLTVNASPEPVTKGQKITVTGQITRADWNTHKYAGYSGRTVSLQFREKGASSYTTVKKVTSGSTGGLKTTVTAGKDGYWRWVYYGNSTTGSAKSAADFVDVR